MFLGSYTGPILDFSRQKKEFLQKITKGRRSEVGGRRGPVFHVSVVCGGGGVYRDRAGGVLGGEERD
jgi:hypothetical protein